jgi:alpha-glucosidase
VVGRLLAGVALAGVVLGAAGAQVLARPGWAGSGVSVEAWWTRAVFYRLRVGRFQDSDGDGRGDLAGVTERLDYLQTLGVDALVLEDVRPEEASGFDELVRAAAGRHLRVLVELDGDGTDAKLQGTARFWLTEGAAGLWVQTDKLAGGDAAQVAGRLRQLRTLTDGFPGQRILVATSPEAAALRGDAGLAKTLAGAAELIAAPKMTTSPPDAAGLRKQLLARLGDAAGKARPLLGMARSAGLGSGKLREAMSRTVGMLLLGSRAAVVVEYGQELGLEPAQDGSAALMQWTPDDVTHPQPPPAAKPVEEPARPEYGPYKPYVPPLPRTLFPAPETPDVVLSSEPPPVPAPYRKAFTDKPLSAEMSAEMAANGATHDAVSEEADPRSVLNLYRRLMQLRNAGGPLHDGMQTMLNHDDLDALVWVRRTGSGTAVAVCNLSSAPLRLSLDDDLRTLRVQPGTLRGLLAGGVQRTGDVALEPDAVFLGEMGR